MRAVFVVVSVVALSGCAGGLDGLLEGGAFDRDRAAPEASGDVVTEAVVGVADAADVAPADSTVRAEAVAEGDTATGDAVRGLTVASLGDATVPGIWIETPLVSRERLVTVVAPNGTTVQATGRPSGGEVGSGSRLSLAAFQALGIPLTDLPTVTVIAE